MHKILITTSGVGSRLGDITKATNKALVRIGKKPAISHIIESYPEHLPIVITLGYHGDHVRQLVEMTYPDRDITFIDVDKFEGTGSSLGYSLLQARGELQCPFIYNACDTICGDASRREIQLMSSDKNWIAGHKHHGSSQYDSYNIRGKFVSALFDKGELDSDFAYMGLIGISDWESFWNILDELYINNSEDSSLNDFAVIREMIDSDIKVEHIELKEWYDIGNVESLHKTRNEFPDQFHILDKVEESIYIIGESVIKFFANPEMIKNRVERSKTLKGLVPTITSVSKNFYKYDFVKGNLAADVITPKLTHKILSHAANNLWIHKKINEHEAYTAGSKFYYHKTKERLSNFWERLKIKDESEIINDELVPSISDMFKEINWESLFNYEPTGYHGDFILDNMIVDNNNNIILIDWRQDFGGLIEAGDMYYDLAKFNHNLTVNHDIINNDQFTVNDNENGIKVDIHRRHSLVESQEEFFNFVRFHGYNEGKIRLLTAIIWLNMSPLHHYPFDKFLYYFGKYNLYKALKFIKNGKQEKN